MSAGSPHESRIDRRCLLAAGGLVGLSLGLGATSRIDPSHGRVTSTAPPTSRPATTPNILLIVADDLDGRIPAAFADERSPRGVTPHLDALSAQSMIFRRAHVAVALCQPSRSAIMTGRFPHRNAAMGFEPIARDISPVTDLFRRRGYLTGILGKVGHLTPVRRFGWDVSRDAWQLGRGRSPGHYRAAVSQFFDRAAGENRPWFLMANPHDPHRPFSGSARESATWTPDQRRGFPAPSQRFDPDRLQPPGFLPDLNGVRREYAQYLGSVRRCDDVVGQILAELDASGQADDTVVVFLSDNGMPVPFAKANCYPRSTLTPLIIRWPGVTTPGAAENDAFVSALDLFPTFCDVIEAPVPEGIDGRSLTSLLHGGSQAGRDRIFTVLHEVSTRRKYEIRCVQDARYAYIWNAWSNGTTTYQTENTRSPTWAAMRRAATRDRTIAQRVELYRHRTPEELYDLASDPACLTNLAKRPAHRNALLRRRRTMTRWMERTKDPLRNAYHSSVG